MSTDLAYEQERYRRFWEQLAEVRRRHPGLRFKVAPGDATAGSATAPRYVYEACCLLLCADDEASREWAEQRVEDRLPGRCRGREPVERSQGRLTRIVVDDEVDIPTEVDALNALFSSEDRGRRGRVTASPNHLVSITYPVNMCPASEPRPVPPKTPPWPPKRSTGGAEVRVLVIDTGFERPEREVADWLADDGVTGGAREVYPPGDADGLPLFQQYAGHGTFVAGVLRCAAPGAEIRVANSLVHAGALLEVDLGTKILAELEQDGWPDLISLSAGGTTHRSCDLLGLRPFLDQLAQHPETLLVAAAGNDGNRDNLFFPAANALDHEGVISVGALRRDGRGRACFSNYGRSVTVFAPGEDHVNAFLSGYYAQQHPVERACRFHQPPLVAPCTCLGGPDYGTVLHFTGLARWSGTSFATPLVAGMIASHISGTGQDARTAARDLLAKRQELLADMDGEVLRVLRDVR